MISCPESKPPSLKYWTNKNVHVYATYISAWYWWCEQRNDNNNKCNYWWCKHRKMKIMYTTNECWSYKELEIRFAMILSPWQWCWWLKKSCGRFVDVDDIFRMLASDVYMSHQHLIVVTNTFRHQHRRNLAKIELVLCLNWIDKLDPDIWFTTTRCRNSKNSNHPNDSHNESNSKSPECTSFVCSLPKYCHNE